MTYTSETLPDITVSDLQEFKTATNKALSEKKETFEFPRYNKNEFELFSESFIILTDYAIHLIQYLEQLKKQSDCDINCTYEHLCIGSNCKKDDKDGTPMPHNCNPCTHYKDQRCNKCDPPTE